MLNPTRFSASPLASFSHFKLPCTSFPPLYRPVRFKDASYYEDLETSTKEEDHELVRFLSQPVPDVEAMLKRGEISEISFPGFLVFLSFDSISFFLGIFLFSISVSPGDVVAFNFLTLHAGGKSSDLPMSIILLAFSLFVSQGFEARSNRRQAGVCSQVLWRRLLEGNQRNRRSTPQTPLFGSQPFCFTIVFEGFEAMGNQP